MGTLLVVAPVLVPQALALFKRGNPRVTVEVQEGTLAALLPQLARGAIDLVVGRLTSDFDSEGLHFEACYDEPMCVVVGRAHPLAGTSGLKLADLADRELDPADPRDRVPGAPRRRVPAGGRRAAAGAGRVGVDPHQHDAAAGDDDAGRAALQRRAPLRRRRDASPCSTWRCHRPRARSGSSPARVRCRTRCSTRCSPRCARSRCGWRGRRARGGGSCASGSAAIGHRHACAIAPEGAARPTNRSGRPGKTCRLARFPARLLETTVSPSTLSSTETMSDFFTSIVDFNNI